MNFQNRKDAMSEIALSVIHRAIEFQQTESHEISRCINLLQRIINETDPSNPTFDPIALKALCVELDELKEKRDAQNEAFKMFVTGLQDISRAIRNNENALLFFIDIPDEPKAGDLKNV